MGAYESFLQNKAVTDPSTGLAEVPELNSMLFSFQRDIVSWGLRRGRAAIFAGCGLGKGPMQMEWADKQPHECLIAAPLAVAQQFIQEAAKFGIDLSYAKNQSEVKNRITVTNYERLDAFHLEQFGAVSLDESSILKSYDGKTRTWLIDAFKNTPFRLCSSATPAPNDFMELGNHAEFLGVMTRTEMLATFFCHDGGDTSKWRLKGHAERDFWRWLCSWAVMIQKPSDIGYDDGDFILPELVMHQLTVKVDTPTEGFLFPVEASTLQERLQARRNTIKERVEDCAKIVNGTDEPFLIWCNLNDESNSLSKNIQGAVEVTGSDSATKKEKAMLGFTSGEVKKLISKVSICGYGMNWQHCNNVAFVGLSDSFEDYYQAIRRCWRFGQKKPVNVYIITAETEGSVVSNIKRKEALAQKMADSMIEHMREMMQVTIRGMSREKLPYKPKQPMRLPAWM